MDALFYLDEIVEVKELNEELTVDIQVSGDNLFYANDILTHNSGYGHSDFDLTATSESLGTPMTMDFMFGLIRTEELDKRGQLMVKQLKSRYGDTNYYNKFLIGIDIKKFKLYNVEESEQNLSDAGKTDADDTTLFDKSQQKRNFDGLIF